MACHKSAMTQTDSTKAPAIKLMGVFLAVHPMTLASFASEIGLGPTGRHTVNRILSGERLPTLEVALAIEAYAGIPAISWWTDEQAAPFQLRAKLLADGKGPPKKQRNKGGRPPNHEKQAVPGEGDSQVSPQN